MMREKAIEILRKRQRYCKVIAEHANETVKADELREIESLDLALTALRGPTREMVERVWFREPYTRLETWDREDGATVYSARNTCMSCGQETPIGNFCCNCGAALTYEAVDMMLERWKEALKDD